jgi:hypothetical protein
MANRKLDVQRLTVATELIGELADGHLDSLVETLTKREGMKLRQHKTKKVWTASHLGIEGAPHPVQRVALHNWANAARRELRKEGV